MFGVVHEIGDLIAARYEVRGIVGSGGAGVVYWASDRELDTEVAVKVINQKLVPTVEDRRLLLHHQRLAQALDHTYCIRVYDAGLHQERPYVTMPFIRGLSLRRIIDVRRESGRVFTAREIEPIFSQLCQALDYAHPTMTHGNLKPDNVLVLPEILKVTDFGLLNGLPRKPFLALQRSRGDNIRYLAPEVRREETHLDRTVDVYGLGVILAEMLTGQVYDDSAAPLGARSGLSPALAEVIGTCVQPSPVARFTSAGAMYRAFVTALSANAQANDDDAVPRAEPIEPAETPTQRIDIDEGVFAATANDELASAVAVPASDAFSVHDHFANQRPSTLEEIGNSAIQLIEEPPEPMVIVGEDGAPIEPLEDAKSDASAGDTPVAPTSARRPVFAVVAASFILFMVVFFAAVKIITDLQGAN